MWSCCPQSITSCSDTRLINDRVQWVTSLSIHIASHQLPDFNAKQRHKWQVIGFTLDLELISQPSKVPLLFNNLVSPLIDERFNGLLLCLHSKGGTHVSPKWNEWSAIDVCIGCESAGSHVHYLTPICCKHTCDKNDTHVDSIQLGPLDTSQSWAVCSRLQKGFPLCVESKSQHVCAFQGSWVESKIIPWVSAGAGGRNNGTWIKCHLIHSQSGSTSLLQLCPGCLSD